MIRRALAIAIGCFVAYAAEARAGEPEAWYPVESPTTEDLVRVEFAPDGTGFAVGNAATVLRYDGTSFQVVPTPLSPILMSTLRVVGPEDVWFVPISSHRLHHLSDGRWSTMVFDQDFTCLDIDFVRPDLGYAAGLFGMLYRYDGVRWERVLTPALTNDRESHLRGLAALAENDVWVGADQFMLHFDGARWARLPLPAGASTGRLMRVGDTIALLDGPVMVRRGASWEVVSELHVDFAALAPGNTLWAIVSGNRPPYLLRLSPPGAEFSRPGRSIIGMSRGPDGLWAVGEGGTILHLEPRRLPVFTDRTFDAGAGVQAMSRAALLVDLDGAGSRDLVLAMPFGRNSFLRAEDSGEFRSQPLQTPGVSRLPDATSLVAADIDGDGWVDLILRPRGRPSARPVHVLRNLGSFRFWDAPLDVLPVGPDDASTAGDLEVADLDGDGDLDVYETRTHTDAGTYPTPNVLHRNDGFGRLTSQPLAHHDGGASLAWTKSALAADLTGDGRTDLLTMNSWGTGNTFFEQTEDGTLSDATEGSGLEGAIHDADGAAAGDIDGDGDLDVLVLSTDVFGPSRLYRNDGRGHFRDVTSASGIDRLFARAARAEMADMDLDGDMDLVLAGAIRAGARSAEGHLRLFVNDGRGHFTDATVKAGVDQTTSDVVVDDFDDDGDLDLYLVRPNDSNRLLANEPPDHGFLKVNLESPPPNRQALGARISVFGPDGALVGFRETTSRHPSAHFGLGDLASVTVEVRFPSGRVARRATVTAKSTIMMMEVSRPERWARDAVFFLQHRWAWADKKRALVTLIVGLSWLLGCYRLARWLGARRVVRRKRTLAGLFVLFAALSVAWAHLTPISAAARVAPTSILFGLGIVLLGVDRAWTRRSEARFVGPYEILSELGRGGMGVVYRARDTSQPARPMVALKVVRPDRVKDPASMRRFVREAEVGARLSHPGIVSMLASGECRVLEGRAFRVTAYLAMECVDGASLAALLAGGERLPLVRAVEIVRDAALGLSAAHAAGVLHRDIKPDNILLSRAGVVKLVDFGIAAIARAPSLTEAGMLVGTLAYLPPERAAGRPEDARGDLYALGAVLYEAVCGQAPFASRANDSASLLTAVLREEPVAPNRIRDDLPDSLNELILAMLAKDPSRRPASASDAAESLDRVLRLLHGEGGATRRVERADGPPASTKAPAPVPIPTTAVVTREVDPFARETLDLPMQTEDLPAETADAEADTREVKASA